VKHTAFALVSLTLAAGLAAGQAAAPTRFCVIQAEAALVSTKDGQAAVAELQKSLDPKKAALEKKQAEIRDLQDRLARQSNTVSQTAKDDLTRQIDTKNKSFTRDVEDYNAEAENAQRKVLDGLTEKMKQVIDKYAKASGCAIVFNVSDPNTPVLYISDSIDVTKAVVDEYDKTLPALPAATKPSAVKPSPAKPTASPLAPATPPPAKKQP
jgi:outer membrane protein